MAQASALIPDEPPREIETWRPENGGAPIRYSTAVFEEIRLEAVDKFMSIPRGGVEIGGVLFGEADDAGVLTVIARRQLTLEYLTGPSFHLSAGDEETLRAMLEQAGSDASLAGLTPVGWYHSHTRSDLLLSPEDLEVHRKFFPGPRQFAMVIRPEKLKPARAAFFVPDAGGRLAASPAQPVFLLETVRATLQAPPAPEKPAETPFVFAAPPTPPVRASRKWRVAAAAAIAAALLAGIGWLRVSSSSAAATAPVALRVSASPGNQVQIEWNHASPDVRAATRGALEIQDYRAGKLMVPLDRDSLQKGNVTYERSSESIEVRLRLFRDSAFAGETVAHFVGALREASVPSARVETRTVEARPPIEVRAHEAPPEERSRAAAVPPPVQVPPRRVSLPPASRADAKSPVLLAAIEQVPASGTVPPAAAGVVLSAPQMATPLPPPPAPKATPAAQTERRRMLSGRAIWTGNLGRGGVLMIDRGRPSTGALNGTIPPGPVRMWAHAAELVDGGMVIYTGAPQGARSEPPSARNGWNATVFQHDAKRSRDIALVEAPSERNNWRMVLRSEARGVSVIVLDWQEAPAQ